MARLDRRSNRDVSRRALSAAQRAGLSLDEWLEQADDPHSGPAPQSDARQPAGAPQPDRSPRPGPARNEVKHRDIRSLSKRLESLSSRLDQLSGLAKGRRADPDEAALRRDVRTLAAGLGDDDWAQTAPNSPAAGAESRVRGAPGSVFPRDPRTGSMLDILNTLDERVNAGWPAYEIALKAAGVSYEAHFYPKTNHGFHNDTTPRYDAAAAELSWQRTIAFFKAKLG